MEIQKLKPIDLKTSSFVNEKWIQEQIANDPSMLGLGDIVLKDKERIQPNAGRLDLLFQDSEANKRYEVELQLGKTDESHIIRTIEYWDIERKRYPQYEHCAVIIAEDITSRFLNVIQLFNGNIPLIALKMSAFDVNGGISLIFTKILDEIKLGLDGDDEEIEEITDRNYWEQKGTKDTVKQVDEIFEIIKEIDNTFELKYNKFYIGLSKNGIASNFAIMRAKKSFVRLEIKSEPDDEIKNILETNELDEMEYSSRNNRYRINFSKNEIKEKRDTIKQLLELSYKKWN
mgnify:CR=1 FL=1